MLFQIRIRLTILIFTIFVSGCFTHLEEKLFKFGAKDLLHIQAYKPGDTLFFENTQNQVDSFLILDYETEERGQIQGFISTKPESDYWLCITQLNKNDAGGFTKQKKMNDVTINYQWLVSFVKYPPSEAVFYNFSFKTFYTQQQLNFGTFHADTLSINKAFFTNYYSINHGYPERLKKPTDIRQIFWTDKEGLVAYKSNDNTWWTKKKNR